jgi:hypothetical protein
MRLFSLPIGLQGLRHALPDQYEVQSGPGSL